MLQSATEGETVHSTVTEFSRLFDQYHGMVFRTAYRLTGNAADAEDVLQNIFLRIVRRSPGVTSRMRRVISGAPRSMHRWTYSGRSGQAVRCRSRRFPRLLPNPMPTKYVNVCGMHLQG